VRRPRGRDPPRGRHDDLPRDGRSTGVSETAVAEEAGAKVGPALYADSLGPKGSPGATYLGALRHDADAMAAGFGGSCDLP
jgi:zinc/manganese transport system substrate-binding protein/manganese/iron transport system substrate-binding protein